MCSLTALVIRCFQRGLVLSVDVLVTMAVLCRSQRYHLVDIVDEVLLNTDFSTTVGHRSGIAVDDSMLFENTTLPAINMDLSSDPDIVNIWKKSYSLEDITSMVDETDSDSNDTVSYHMLP